MSRIGIAVDLWCDMVPGTFITTATSTVSVYVPAMKFDDPRNSMYIALISSGV